jgi:hypothetical protein
MAKTTMGPTTTGEGESLDGSSVKLEADLAGSRLSKATNRNWRERVRQGQIPGLALPQKGIPVAPQRAKKSSVGTAPTDMARVLLHTQ